MQGTMKALVYHGPGDIRLETVPVPQIEKPSDAIVRVTKSTICGTDIGILNGKMPEVEPGRILGHEFVGEVVEVGPNVYRVKPGDKVAVSCVTQCGECFQCRQGTYSHCESGSWIFGYMIDGAQAEYVRVPHANMGLHKIPDNLDETDVLFVGDIISTGYFGAEQACIEPGDTVAVMGCGPVGMCAMASARLWGPSQIIAVDTIDERLEIALKQGIADVALNPLRDDVPAKIRELNGGMGADRTIEAVGATPTFNLALDCVRDGGNVSIIGVFGEPQTLPMNSLWIKNIRISMGLVNANRIPEILKLIQRGKLNLNFLVTHERPLNDVVEGYDIFGKKKDNVLKWVVTPYEYSN